MAIQHGMCVGLNKGHKTTKNIVKPKKKGVSCEPNTNSNPLPRLYSQGLNSGKNSTKPQGL